MDTWFTVTNSGHRLPGGPIHEPAGLGLTWGSSRDDWRPRVARARWIHAQPSSDGADFRAGPPASPRAAHRLATQPASGGSSGWSRSGCTSGVSLQRPHARGARSQYALPQTGDRSTEGGLGRTRRIPNRPEVSIGGGGFGVSPGSGFRRRGGVVPP